MSEQGYELNLDGIVGPTHNYSGLSYGNVASMSHQQSISNPKEAALQGLEKMKMLHGWGLKQAMLPPQERPHIASLRALGFKGTPADMVSQAMQKEAQILYNCCSASSMWAANAATITASDSMDKHVHITPANLISYFHRSIETDTTTRILKAIFSNPVHFVHHTPLSASPQIADEGAANHTRFCKRYDRMGVHLFVYGRYGFRDNSLAPKKFPARQCFEASQAIARLHQIYPERIVYAQQNPRAIDAGVFHNDVIAVGNQNLYIYHEAAYIGSDTVMDQIRQKVHEYCDTEMIFVKIPERRLSLEDAVSTYLFNSQIVTDAEGTMRMIAPIECRENPVVLEILNEIVSNHENPIKDITYVNLRESMRNGGGPACLRLRVPLNENELNSVLPDVLYSDRLHEKIENWINKHYRDRLSPQDLADPKLMQESQAALDELTKILNLGSIYSFQL